MEAGVGTAPRTRLPAGLLGMFLLIVAVEATLARHELDVVSTEDWQYVQAGRDAAQRVRGRELLILGDSLVKFGVLPQVVARHAGRRVYNLAVGGGQAPTTYELLRRALEGGARPSAVVVDFCPFLVAVRPRIAREHLPFLLGYGAAARLACDARDPVFLADLVCRRTLISFRCRRGVRSWICSALAGRSSPNRSVLLETLRHLARYEGAIVMPSVRGLRVVGAAQQRWFYPKGWTPDGVNARYIRRTFELAQAHGVTVYWLIPPIHPAVQRANEDAGFDARHVAFVKEQQRRYPGLVVIDGRHAGYDPDVFFDADHLGRVGAFALSEDLGGVLRSLARETPPGRWVALPPYRPRPTDPAIACVRGDAFLR